MGKVSKNSSGKLGTAELLRVYGELREVGENPNVSSNTKPISHADSLREQWLHSQIEKLQEDVKAIRAESLAKEREYQIREDRILALLEHKPKTAADLIASVGGLFGKLFK